MTNMNFDTAKEAARNLITTSGSLADGGEAGLREWIEINGLDVTTEEAAQAFREVENEMSEETTMTNQLETTNDRCEHQFEGGLCYLCLCPETNEDTPRAANALDNYSALRDSEFKSHEDATHMAWSAHRKQDAQGNTL